MTTANEIPSVNYHLWKACNMRCGFCFATFQDFPPDFLPQGHLGLEDSLSVVESLGRAGFRKINFAGGEPTLCTWLRDLIVRAKEQEMTTSIVTNGSRINPEWLESVKGVLDWVALSIDSLNPGILRRIGRSAPTGPMSEQDYLRVVNMLKESDVRLKINTVVMRHNLDESLTDFILRVGPERWKLLQVLSVDGQNDQTVDDYTVSRDEFERYVEANRWVEGHGIIVVPEDNAMMTGSYVMVDPAGRFFDNVAGTHTYSEPILDVGVDEALRAISTDSIKFLARGGWYS